MKRILTSILTVVMISTLLVGCAQNTPSSTPAQPQQAEANDWPKKTIQIVTGVKPGGDTDFNARAAAEFLKDELGQTVVVVNIDGGAGSVGARQAHDSAPDGYTAFVGHTALLINQATGMLDFGLDGFEVIGVLSENAGDIICVSKNSNFKTLKDLIEATTKEPKKYRMGVNIGSTSQIISSMLEDVADSQFNIVEGGGAAEKAVGLLGGQLDVTILPYGTSKSYIESGDFLPLAVIRSERNSKFPDIPTALEQGYDVVFPTRYFIAVPKGTPKDILDEFRAAVKNVTENKDYAKMIDEAYSQAPLYMDAETALSEFGKLQEKVNKYAIK